MTLHRDVPGRDTASPPSRTRDRELVLSIVSGSREAWHSFIRDYSGLIYVVVRRHLVASGDDEIRAAYVDVLHKLYKGKFAEYRGDSALSAWISAIARGIAIDRARKLEGRFQPPLSYKTLSPLEKQVFSLYFVEKLGLEIVIQQLEWLGFPVDVDELAAKILHIESTVGDRFLCKVEFDGHAKRSGISSGRFLQYCQRTRDLYDEHERYDSPDGCIDLEDTRNKSARLREVLSRLEDDERRVLRLRYRRGWPASRVAEVLKLPNQWSVHSIARRGIRKLQRMLQAQGYE